MRSPDHSLRHSLPVGGLAVVLTLLAAAPPAAGEALSLDLAKKVNQYVFDVWGKEDGLPSGSVLDVVQTRDGYLWLATAAGLVRFDGARFTTFNTGNVPGLRSNNFHALGAARDGSLWAGALDGGLLHYQGGEVTVFSTADGLAGDSVRALTEDRGGTLWIGTRGAGVGTFEGGRLTPVEVPRELREAEVRAIHEEPEGTLWFGTTQGLFRLAGGTFRHLTAADGLPDVLVNALASDLDGTLWIGTRDGLARLDAQAAAQADPVVTDLTRGSELLRHGVHAIHVDRSGSVWFGLQEVGLARLAGGVLETFGLADGLPDARIRALFQDREGSLWVGSYNGGLYRFKSGKLTSLTAAEGFTDKGVTAVFEDGAGNLWFGAYPDAGLLRRDPGGIVTTATTADGLPSDLVWSIAESRGVVWAGTEAGLARFVDGSWSAVSGPGLGDGPVHVVYADPGEAGTLWLGLFARGACRYQGGACTPVTTADPTVRFFRRDRTGALWIGTGNGLHRLSGERTEVFTRRDGLASNDVTASHEDASGTLWFGTDGGGLSRYSGGVFTTYTTRQGLFTDQVWAILEDDAGFFWTSSDEGIFRVRKDAFAELDLGRIAALPFDAYGTADGMKHAECNGWGFPSGVRTRGGELVFPTGGLVAVRPEALAPNPVPPPVLLEEVLVDRQRVDLVPGWTVPAGKRDLELHYTALSLRDPDRVAFRYRLEGYDRDWIDAGNRRVAFYTNVGPGDYRFRVVAANDDGVWNETGAEVSFSVAAQYFETAWFRALSALVLVLLVAAGFRLRSRRIEARNAELEAAVRERTRELHRAREAAEAAATAKSRFLANMSHEVRTPMAGVLGILEVLAAGELEPAQRKHLEMARGSAKGLLTIIDDILDFSKIEAGKLELERVAFDLHRTVAEAVAVLAERVHAKGLELGQHVAPEVPTELRGDPGRLRQVLTNLLANAVKFTAKGEVTIAVELEEEWDDRVRLRFEVRDTGIGIAAAEDDLFDAFTQADSATTARYGGTGLGLAICKQLVELMGGSIGFSSPPGGGATFWFTVCLGRSTREAREDAPVLAPPGRLHGHVLLVEDDPVNLEVGLAMLSWLGLTADHAGDGHEAVAATEQNAYDLVLMDWKLPEMDGFEATRQIRQREDSEGRPRTPIVALTANAMRGDRERCLDAGMDDYLTKPFAPDAFETVLGRWLARED